MRVCRIWRPVGVTALLVPAICGGCLSPHFRAPEGMVVFISVHDGRCVVHPNGVITKRDLPSRQTLAPPDHLPTYEDWLLLSRPVGELHDELEKTPKAHQRLVVIMPIGRRWDDDVRRVADMLRAAGHSVSTPEKGYHPYLWIPSGAAQDGSAPVMLFVPLSRRRADAVVADLRRTLLPNARAPSLRIHAHAQSNTLSLGGKADELRTIKEHIVAQLEKATSTQPRNP